MCILTGPEIEEQMRKGAIVIDPYLERIGSNSVDLHLGPVLKVYNFRNSRFLVHDGRNEVTTIEIPVNGYELKPGTLYLASTLEYTETHGFVPNIDGRSSFGRLGMGCHVTAGRGDDGFCGNWTLEITVVHPLLVRRGARCCQITYNTVHGKSRRYSGRYQGDRSPQEMKL